MYDQANEGCLLQATNPRYKEGKLEAPNFGRAKEI
jgi:hypothetical protein